MVKSDDIKTPRGLKIGVRFRKEGKTYVHMKVGKQFDTLSVKDLVECVEGIPVKDVIIIPKEEPQE